MFHKKNIHRNQNHRVGKKSSDRVTKRHRRLIFIVVSVFIVIGLAGSGTFYYTKYVKPFRQVILTVDNEVIRMDYFLKRIRMGNTEPSLMLQQLTYEQVAMVLGRQYAITISPSDIDEELKIEAGNLNNDVLTSADFQEWYDNQLKTTGLTDSEYRQIVKTNIVAVRLLEYLAEDIPTSAEQIHLYIIVTATSNDAATARLKITNLDDFITTAGEISLDTQTKTNGGELGWIPRGVTPYDEVVFQLDIEQISEPVAIDSSSPNTSQYAIFLVSEKDPNRVIDADPLEILRSRALYNLIQQQIPQYVKYSYTPEDSEWVNKQLAKD
jgi:parvulin-like peptidyl-prolyl isomerase